MEPTEHKPMQSLRDMLTSMTERFFGSGASPLALLPAPQTQVNNGSQRTDTRVVSDKLGGFRQNGHLKTPPKSDVDKAFDTIRPEFNIARHADLIFAPAHAKNLHKPVSRAWVETLTDGTKVKASIMVEPYNGKRPTTKTKKVFYAMHSMYEHKGWNDEERTNFSLHEIARVARMKWNGGRAAAEIRKEGLQLRGTLIHWKFSFQDTAGGRVSLEEPISILDSFRLLTREQRAANQLFLTVGSFRFNEYIRGNLKASKTKPTNVDVVLRIKGELASVVYAHLDVVLSEKNFYRITTKKLFEALHFEGETEYRYPSGRKRKLDRVIKELEGIRLSTGVLKLRLEKCADGKDYNFIATKTEPTDTSRHALPERVEPANPREAIPLIIQDVKQALSYHRPDRDRLFTLIAECYDAELIYRALSEYKADGHRAKHPLRYFLSILHRLAHARGLLWLWKQCPQECKYLSRE